MNDWRDLPYVQSTERVPSNDERRAEWAEQFYSLGLHRNDFSAPDPEDAITEYASIRGE